jgi:hypothetical protein
MSDCRQLPPRLAEWLLARYLPGESRDPMLGDLAEDFREYALPRFGRRGARRWYWKQAVRVITQNARNRARYDGPSWMHGVFNGLGTEIRSALRGLAKSPAFTLTCTLTVGIAIATATIIFSALDALLLRPLPFPEPGSLVRIHSAEPARSSNLLENSLPDFNDWKAHVGAFDDVAAYITFDLNLSGGSRPEPVDVTFASASLFDVLGVHPVHGRAFVAEEDRPGGARYKAVISDDLWRRRFGADPMITGQTIDYPPGRRNLRDCRCDAARTALPFSNRHLGAAGPLGQLREPRRQGLRCGCASGAGNFR